MAGRMAGERMQREMPEKAQKLAHARESHQEKQGQGRPEGAGRPSTTGTENARSRGGNAFAHGRES